MEEDAREPAVRFRDDRLCLEGAEVVCIWQNWKGAHGTERCMAVKGTGLFAGIDLRRPRVRAPYGVSPDCAGRKVVRQAAGSGWRGPGSCSADRSRRNGFAFHPFRKRKAAVPLLLRLFLPGRALCRFFWYRVRLMQAPRLLPCVLHHMPPRYSACRSAPGFPKSPDY